jgi:hypothetical protein
MMHMPVIFKSLSQMREPRTIGRTNRVDPAFIIREVQEFARRSTVHPIAIAATLPLQVFFLKRTDCDPEIL